MLLLIVDLVAKKGMEGEVLAVFEKLVKPSQEEEGCIDYVFYQSQDNPLVFVVVEKWKDQAALDHHTTLPHYTQNLPKLSDLLAEPPIMKKYNVAIG